MYGTVAHIKVKPGMLEKLKQSFKEDETGAMAGYVGSLVYQLDADTNACIMAVVFKDKEAYVANANSPEQDARYREFVGFLEAAPEWHDGEVILSDFKLA